MPPKAKISREMILDAAFEIVRSEGAEKLTVRTISEKLKCSTQPVMYYFETIEEIRKNTYKRADEFHSQYIKPTGENENPLLEIGLKYIRFAYEERHLFCLLFQTNQYSGLNMMGLMAAPELSEVLEILSKLANCDIETAKKIFLNMYVTAHGCASLIANNSMEYDEDMFKEILLNCNGAM